MMPCTELWFELSAASWNKPLSQLILHISFFFSPVYSAPWHSGFYTEFCIVDRINCLAKSDIVMGIALQDYRPWLCQPTELSLQRMFPTCSLWTDEIRGLRFFGEVLMRVLTPERLVDVWRKQTHMQTHADHVCHAAWCLESHERPVSTEWGNSWRTMPGESAAGDENEQPSYRSWQVHAQAGLCEGLS